MVCNIPDSHGAAAEHLLLIGSEQARGCGWAEMQEVVLQAGDPLGEDLEPLGRQQGEDGALGRDAVLKDFVLACFSP